MMFITEDNICIRVHEFSESNVEVEQLRGAPSALSYRARFAVRTLGARAVSSCTPLSSMCSATMHASTHLERKAQTGRLPLLWLVRNWWPSCRVCCHGSHSVLGVFVRPPGRGWKAKRWIRFGRYTEGYHAMCCTIVLNCGAGGKLNSLLQNKAAKRNATAAKCRDQKTLLKTRSPCP